MMMTTTTTSTTTRTTTATTAGIRNGCWGVSTVGRTEEIATVVIVVVTVGVSLVVTVGVIAVPIVRSTELVATVIYNTEDLKQNKTLRINFGENLMGITFLTQP